jgi:hypothetical protein
MKHLTDYGLAFKGLVKDGLSSLGMSGIDISGSGVIPPITGDIWLMYATFPEPVGSVAKYINANVNTIDFSYYCIF